MKTSVVIPSFNSASTIALCLSSLREQKREPYEVILVDSSNDETPDLVRDGFPEVTLHHLPTQTMPGAGRNIGMSLATGDLILFIDADAVAAPDWIKEHERLHTEHPEITMFGGSILNQNPEFLFSRLSFMAEFTGYGPRDKPGDRTIVPSVNMSLKRGPLLETGVQMPDTSLPGGEEVFFCNELIRKGHRIRFDPAPAISHINRTSYRAFIKHMASSGFAGGAVADSHEVAFRSLRKLGGFVVLVAPVRLMLVWKRLLRTNAPAFLESLLYAPILLWGFVVHMWNYHRGASR